MKRCPKCGHTEPSSSKFCTACGAKLDGVRQNPFRQEEIPRAQEESIEKKPKQNEALREPPRKRKAAPVVIPVLVLVLIAAVVGVVLAVKLLGGGEEELPAGESGTAESVLPSADLDLSFESETPSVTPEQQEILPTETVPAETTPAETAPAETPAAETAQPSEAPAESPAESQTVWVPVEQTKTTTHTYDGVTIQGDYVFSDSNSRYLSESELVGLTKQELSIARNEIFARRGRKFTTDALQDYFDSCDWYTGLYSADTFDLKVTLNDYEKKNAVLILDYERKLGYK